jgi:NitT/TauT family transport system substrate-binding protein
MKNLGTAATLLAIAIGCAERRAPPAAEPLTMAVGTLPHFALVHVAQARGFFAAEGLSVTLQPYPFGKSALAALIAGEADLATCGTLPVVWAELHGDRLALLASIATSTKSSAVVARKAARISVAADLKGKRIGVTRGTSGEYFLDTLLLRNWVEPSAVHVVDLAPDAMAGALARGEVDAVATWEPTLLGIQDRLGDAVITFYEEALQAEVSVLVGLRGFGQRRPEVAKRALRALGRAEALFREQPDEARGTVGVALGDPSRAFDVALRKFEFQVRLDQGLLVLMENEARWARSTTKTPNGPLPDFLEVLDPEPLLAVRADAVGLIR